MSVPGEFVAGDVLAASEMNALPAGVLGYAQALSNQTGISSTTDLTNLSVAVTVAPSRRIKITGHFRVLQNTGAGIVQGFINEGATQLQNLGDHTLQANERDTFDGSVVISPSSGAHTYKLRLMTSANTVDMQSGSTTPAFILVEDIGPA